ncbi:unnamed protein product [Moneuplotes crassus]|uniref:Uncharacterized protein n=1 Tax=Euplotes crassus TaxID=5936 RepID=A0AAD1UIT4_EUPCR|nr:unnamed protein product [Moneuplotes crassus]
MNSRHKTDSGATSPSFRNLYHKDSTNKRKNRLNPDIHISEGTEFRKKTKPKDLEKEEKKYETQRKTNFKLNQKFKRNQARNLQRENDYRKHIEELQKDLKVRLGFEVGVADENFQKIKGLKDQLHSKINEVHQKVWDLKQEQEEDIARKLSIDQRKVEFGDNDGAKGVSKEGLKDRENQLNQHLEYIASIAQKIQDENVSLVKKNSELKKQYQHQENDRELLLKQLVMLKKENSQMKQEINYYGKITEEKKAEEDEQIDLENSPEKSMSKSDARTLLSSRGKQRRKLQKGQRMYLTTKASQAPKAKSPDCFSSVLNPAPLETEEDKILRYERIIEKLEKNLEFEERSLKNVQNQCKAELRKSTEIEDMLDECVHQVKVDIQKRNRNSKKKQVKVPENSKKYSTIDDIDFTEDDGERVLELLLSQDKALELLYGQKSSPSKGLSTAKPIPIIKEEVSG